MGSGNKYINLNPTPEEFRKMFNEMVVMLEAEPHPTIEEYFRRATGGAFEREPLKSELDKMLKEYMGAATVPNQPMTIVPAEKPKGTWKRITSGSNYTPPKKKRRKTKRTRR